MLCKICKKNETSNPKHICGFCMLHNTLADYSQGGKAKDFVENMPTDKTVTKEGIEGFAV